MEARPVAHCEVIRFVEEVLGEHILHRISSREDVAYDRIKDLKVLLRYNDDFTIAKIELGTSKRAPVFLGFTERSRKDPPSIETGIKIATVRALEKAIWKGLKIVSSTNSEKGY